MSDQELIALLRIDPERGMEALITQYTGLLWSVASRLLSEPEDVKDCVNDTFAEFFCHLDRFEPTKGSLKGYLAVITKRIATKRYWENRRADAIDPLPVSEDPFCRLEQQDELEAALKTLSPLDEAIVRMKYYDGMTAAEIASSLGLPYETVKKRHQRSLKKLLKALTVGLVIAVLLAACAYAALYYFGIVPGYGVNTDAENSFYLLEQGGTVETDDYCLTVTDAWWNGGMYVIDADLCYRESADASAVLPSELLSVSAPLPCFTLLGTESVGYITTIHRQADSDSQDTLRLLVSAGLPDTSDGRVELTLLCDGIPLSLVLRPAEEELMPEQAGYYTLTERDGGLLAIPRLEDGELTVSIYPLNAGAFETEVGLTRSVWSGFGGAEVPITVTSEDGNVLTGQPVEYSPFHADGYLDWSFGPAEAGTYTLCVPYVYQTPAESEVFEWELLLSESPVDLGLTIALPGANVTLGQLAPTEPIEMVSCGETTRFFPAEMYEGYCWWTLEADYDAEVSERFLCAVPLSVSPVGSADTALCLRSQLLSDPEGGGFFALRDYVLFADDTAHSLLLHLDSADVFYRWEHEFRISFEIAE